MVTPKKTEKKPIKESKVDRFIRLAKPRVERILKCLRILGNCSNRSSYEYTDEQIITIFHAVQEAVDNTLNKFTQTKAEQEAFEF